MIVAQYTVCNCTLIKFLSLLSSAKGTGTVTISFNLIDGSNPDNVCQNVTYTGGLEMEQDSHYLTKWLSFIQSYVEDGFDDLLDKIGLFFLDFQALTKILKWYVSTEKKDSLSMEELPEVCPYIFP